MKKEAMFSPYKLQTKVYTMSPCVWLDEWVIHEVEMLDYWFCIQFLNPRPVIMLHFVIQCHSLLTPPSIGENLPLFSTIL